MIARNLIRTFGSECFDVKENAHSNTFEDNVCSGSIETVDFDGSDVELRGYQNIVRNNMISASAGYAVKISSDEEYDKGGNVVENNHMSGSAVALKLEAKAVQGSMCGNVVAETQSLLDIDDDANFTADITAAMLTTAIRCIQPIVYLLARHDAPAHPRPRTAQRREARLRTKRGGGRRRAYRVHRLLTATLC